MSYTKSQRQIGITTCWYGNQFPGTTFRHATSDKIATFFLLKKILSLISHKVKHGKFSEFSFPIGLPFVRYYGGTVSEKVLGECFKAIGVPRDQIIVSTKCGRYVEGFDFSAERVTCSIDESLTRLGLDYVDILQCHDIEFVSLDQVKIIISRPRISAPINHSLLGKRPSECFQSLVHYLS